jgi:hypothetical protein
MIGPYSNRFIMNKNKLLLPFLLFTFGVVLTTSGQDVKQTSASQNYALEVSYIKGRPFVYQRIGGWTWYDGFQIVQGFQPEAGVLPVGAVKLYTREEAGSVKVKVTILRGRNIEFEYNVAEYTVGEEKVALRDLARFGVIPFEVSLVRAPSTAAYMPKVNNSTRSLVVSVEPVVSNLPTYKIRVLNNSAKAVAGFSYNTWLEGRRRFTGMPQQFDGTPLITVGNSYEKEFPYALKTTTESTGEVPQPIEGLELNILAVIFADGTFEGDRVEAARFRGYKLGEKIQLTRILELLRSKSAVSRELLGPKVDELNYKITLADVTPLLTEFQALPDAEAENMRSAAEASASRIQKDLAGTFGSGKAINSAVFAAAVNAAIAKCQKWLDSLP